MRNISILFITKLIGIATLLPMLSFLFISCSIQTKTQPTDTNRENDSNQETDLAEWAQYFLEQHQFEWKKREYSTSWIIPDNISTPNGWTSSSHYLRESGWHLRALLDMYKATNDEVFLNKFVETSDVFFDPYFWNNKSQENTGKSWSTARYSITLLKNFDFEQENVAWRFNQANHLKANSGEVIKANIDHYLIRHKDHSHYPADKKINYFARLPQNASIMQTIKSRDLNACIEKSNRTNIGLRLLFFAKKSAQPNTSLTFQLLINGKETLSDDISIETSDWDRIYTKDFVITGLADERTQNTNITFKLLNKNHSTIDVDLVHVQQYTDYILHDANIAVPIMEFCNAVKHMGNYDEKRKEYFSTVNNIIRKWIDNDKKNSYGEVPSGTKTILWPKDSCYWLSWKDSHLAERANTNRIYPFNMVFSFIELLYWHDQYNNSNSHYQIIKNTQDWFLKTSKIEVRDNAYVWNYLSTDYDINYNQPEDLNHARLDINAFMVFNAIYNSGDDNFKEFSDKNMGRYARTFLYQMGHSRLLKTSEEDIPNTKLATFVDGDTKRRIIPIERYFLAGWMELSKFDRDIWQLGKRMYTPYVRNDQKLGIPNKTSAFAEIVKYWPERR